MRFEAVSGVDEEGGHSSRSLGASKLESAPNQPQIESAYPESGLHIITWKNIEIKRANCMQYYSRISANLLANTPRRTT